MHTLLPIMGALQQRHLELQAERFRYPHPLEKVRLQRFPFPPYIEHHDQKNYALVLTRFCIGMLIPFSLFVAKLTDEKATGIKEMLRVAGVNDWVYWVSHYLSAFFMHLIIVTLMLLFLCVKRNEEGRAFVQFSDPALLFVILMFFCSQCMVHAMCLSLFFANLEHGANWANFYDRAATPDNVTLAEIVFIGFTFDCFLGIVIWYLDNVLCMGPGLSKSFLYPFKDYDGVVAVNDVNLRIFDNQITVLLGHNGAGKTTLLNMITGFVPASSGRVLVGGYSIETCTREARRSMGYCAQYNVFFEDLTVEEHLMFFAIVRTPHSLTNRICFERR
ncbi:hypothetical protein V5799_026287 [Amblyomma americanum]|uniref:ABC transporter domain-containing protein n=1 Tax=Amblyomma americanum TaxID=6943 RepID=A0AAQ4DJ11_AMBAM